MNMNQLNPDQLEFVSAGTKDDCNRRESAACKELGEKAGRAYDANVPSFMQNAKDRQDVVNETVKACHESLDKFGVCRP